VGILLKSFIYVLKNNFFTLISSFLLYFCPLLILFTLVLKKIFVSKYVNQYYFLTFMVTYTIFETLFMYGSIYFVKYSEKKSSIKDFFSFLFVNSSKYIFTFFIVVSLTIFGFFIFIIPGFVLLIFIPPVLFSVFYYNISGFDALRKGYILSINRPSFIIISFGLINIFSLIVIFFIRQVFVLKYYFINLILFFFFSMLVITFFELIIYLFIGTIFKKISIY